MNNQCVQDFIDLVHQLYDTTIHLGDMDRVYQRDAVQAAYSITKDEQLKLILEQEEGDVKVCEAMRELFEDATNKGIALGETKAFMANINSIMIKFNLNAD